MFRSVLCFMVLGLITANTWAATLATIGDYTLTDEDFNKKYSIIQKETLNPPSRAKFLRDLINFEVGVQEAKKANVHTSYEYKEAARQLLFKAYMEKHVFSTEKFKNIKVSAREMKAYYARNPEVRVRHILVQYPRNNATKKAAARARAQEIYAEVTKSDRDFEQLVRQYTDDPTGRLNGGDLGYMSAGDLLPNFYAFIKSMQPGQIKGIVETRNGFHIVKFIGKRSFKEANQDKLRQSVYFQKRSRLQSAFFRSKRKQYAVKVNKGLLER